MVVFDEWSPTPYLNPWTLCYVFSPLSSCRGEWEWLWWMPDVWPAPAHYSCVSSTVSSQQFSVFIYQKIIENCPYLRLISSLTSLEIQTKQHPHMVTLDYIVFSLPPSCSFKTSMNSQGIAEWLKKCMLMYVERVASCYFFQWFIFE